MIKNKSPQAGPSQSSTKNSVCNLDYLTETMGGKKPLIKGIMDVFLSQVPEELKRINEAVEKIDYPTIKNIAHTMKSSVSIMGITVLTPVLKEIEDLGLAATDIEKIKKLNETLNSICKQALQEIEKEKINYV